LTNGLTATALQDIISEVLTFTWLAGFDVFVTRFDGASGNRSWAELVSAGTEFRRAFAFDNTV
jgi:hypothetical protein